MKSLVTASFRRDFDRLPTEVQERARNAYRSFLADPHDRRLRFKRLKTSAPWWSVRIGGGYRAVGSRVEDDVIVWFFIGTHADYDRLLAKR